MNQLRLVRNMVLAILPVVAGCQGIQQSAFFKGSVTTQGASPLIEIDSFEKIDLALVLHAESDGMKEDDDLDTKRRTLAKAFEEFNTPGMATKRRRNQVQERIIAASNQRCGQYKEHLKRLDAATNLFLGGLTTALAGAGAIFTAVDTVRALAGSAAIVSGIRAEFNEAYFQSLTVQLVTNGFEAKRRETYEEILKQRKKGLTEYPVERAIGDAVAYHQQCSLIAGLEQAAKSLNRAEDPGLKALNRVLSNFHKTRSAMDIAAGLKPPPRESFHPFVAFEKASIALNNLKTAMERLQKTAAINGIAADDPKTALQPVQELKKKIDAAGGKATKDKLLKDMKNLIDAAKKELDAKEEAAKEKYEAWPKLVAKLQSAEASGQGVDEADAAMKQHQLVAEAITIYYEDLADTWSAMTSKANGFMRKMEHFKKKAKELGVTLEEEILKKEEAKKSSADVAGVIKSDILGACQPISKLSESARKRLIKDMKDPGGYVLLFRHAQRSKAGRVTPPKDSGDSCEEDTDNLTAAGRGQAEKIGTSLKEGKTIVKAFASPRCRTLDTARIILNQLPPGVELARSDELKKTATELKAFLPGLPIRPKENTLVVSHSGIIDGYIGQLTGNKPENIGFACGEAAVLKVLQTRGIKKTFRCEARVLPEEWKNPKAAIPEWLRIKSRCSPRAALELRK